MSTKLLRNFGNVAKLANSVCCDPPQQLLLWSSSTKESKRRLLTPPKAEPNVEVLSDTFVPELVFKYNPLKYYLSKMKMWKLKWTWDRSFSESQFVDQSKQAAATLTDIVRLRDTEKIAEFSTSNAYYQMANELINFPHESCAELLHFRKDHIRQAVPIKVQLHNVLGLKYAVIDVIMVGLRHVGDCEGGGDLDKMKQALIEMDPELKDQITGPTMQLPYVFIELFMRFRRNYSNVNQPIGGQPEKATSPWLVSVYKICRFNIFTMPPTMET
ncbi:uncharacterized protein LOC115634618 [Scaptodrosophila lebanonensis]|uniref:Uncharacterized protein LOC115634618 n=1 Tax=Drosophila lebanonensis TaxID=7225 RepID=A0A6J2UIX5_DROLE|nr:uncharacterized protein LOC115634618 [Scaptodrosophila lebanonensis]